MNDVLTELERLERARRPGRAGDGRRRQALGAAAARSEDGDQRARRDRRRRSRADASRAPWWRSPTWSSAAARRSSSTSGSPTREAWDVGLPCGGEIDVWVQRTSPAAFDGDRARRRPRRRGDAARGRETRARSCCSRPTARRSGSLGSPELDDEARAPRRRAAVDRASERRGSLFVDVVAPPPRLIAVRRGRHRRPRCARSPAPPAGVPYVVDPRARFATRERFPDAEEVVAAWPEEAFAAARRDRPRDVDRGPHPRPQARRRGAPRSRCARRRGSSARWARGARRPSARERLLAAGLDGGRARAPVSAGRPGPRRGQRGGDRAVDPGRDRGRAPRPRGRTAGERQGPDPRGPGLIGAADPRRGCRDARSAREPKLLADARRAPAGGARDPRPVRRRRTRAGRRSCSARTLSRSCAQRSTSGAPSRSSARTGTTGQAASLRCGLGALEGADKVIVTLGDSPLMTPAVIARFVGEPARHAARVYDGRPGHPVVLGPEQIARVGDAERRPRGPGPAARRARRSNVGSCAQAATSTPLKTWRRFAMKLEQSFEVAAPVERVWEALIDVEQVAPCLPGAAITGRNDDGSYNGDVHGQDRADHRRPTAASSRWRASTRPPHTATMQAKGTDKRGQGGAKATIVSTLTRRPAARDPRRGRHRLPHHRPAGPVRPRRDDRGHLRAAAAGVRKAAAGDRWRPRSPPRSVVPSRRPRACRGRARARARADTVALRARAMPARACCRPEPEASRRASPPSPPAARARAPRARARPGPEPVPEAAAPPSATSASASTANRRRRFPLEPLDAGFARGSVLWDRAKKNPAPVVAGVVVASVFLLRRRRRRRHS